MYYVEIIYTIMCTIYQKKRTKQKRNDQKNTKKISEKLYILIS